MIGMTMFCMLTVVQKENHLNLTLSVEFQMTGNIHRAFWSHRRKNHKFL